MPIFNSFDGSEKILNDINNNEKIEKSETFSYFYCYNYQHIILQIAKRNHHKRL
jgi:hypothetical protein